MWVACFSRNVVVVVVVVLERVLNLFLDLRLQQSLSFVILALHATQLLLLMVESEVILFECTLFFLSFVPAATGIDYRIEKKCC